MKCVVVSIAAGWGVASPMAPAVRTPYVQSPSASAFLAPRDYRSGAFVAPVQEPLAPMLLVVDPLAAKPASSSTPPSSAYLAALCAFGGAVVGFSLSQRTATLAVTPENETGRMDGSRGYSGIAKTVPGKPLEFDDDVIETSCIVERYLDEKYKIASAEAEGKPTAASLRSAFSDVLPPLPRVLFQQELDKAMNPLGDGNVSLEDFKACALGNSDWKIAGPLTVCELIYIDALVNYYTFGRTLLNNEDYNELKKYLYGEGSSLPQMSMDESKFVTAVFRYHRGEVIMEDAVYANLKKKLQDGGSWVVKREKTPNEILGLRSFMYYLHLGMEADAAGWEIPTSLRVVQSGGALLGTKGQKGLPAEIQQDDPGFSLEEWFQEQFKNKTFMMDNKDPFWYSVIPEEKRKLGKGRKVKEGPFSWLCYLGAAVLGESLFNKIRGTLIAKHSQIITQFVANMDLSAKTRGNLIKIAKKNGDELGFLVGE
jgi:hypothetical protein